MKVKRNGDKSETQKNFHLCHNYIGWIEEQHSTSPTFCHFFSSSACFFHSSSSFPTLVRLLRVSAPRSSFFFGFTPFSSMLRFFKFLVPPPYFFVLFSPWLFFSFHSFSVFPSTCYSAALARYRQFFFFGISCPRHHACFNKFSLVLGRVSIVVSM